MRRTLIAVALAALAVLIPARDALACGALVASNGAIRLGQATTLVAWHGGVEHYLTSFSYQGDVAGVGYIVPLPAIPTKIEEGGGWTLQRLEREVAPPPPRGAVFASDAQAAGSAQVIQQVQVAALDITVIKGNADEVVRWCAENRFELPQDSLDHLRGYAAASPIFMAAKYDFTRAKAQGLLVADGTPVLLTMSIPHLWVPLEVLADDESRTNADLFLLTDQAVTTGSESFLFPSSEGRELPGAPGFTLVKQLPMNAALYRDLSTDKNMGWVPRTATLSYLQLRAAPETVTYDLAVSSTSRLQLAQLGTPPEVAAVQAPAPPFRGTDPVSWLAVLLLPLLGVVGVVAGAAVFRTRRPATVTVRRLSARGADHGGDALPRP